MNYWQGVTVFKRFRDLCFEGEFSLYSSGVPFVFITEKTIAHTKLNCVLSTLRYNDHSIILCSSGKCVILEIETPKSLRSPSFKSYTSP
jgi:hypothetical protein